MKLHVDKIRIKSETENGFFLNSRIYYYLCFKHEDFDHEVAELLNIPYKKYIKILKKYKASKNIDDIENDTVINNELYYFKTQEDAEAALNSKELLPHIILFNLTEGG